MKKNLSLLLGLLVCGAVATPVMSSVQAAELESFTLDPYYVTATGYERMDLDIPASTEVFTRERLEEMDCRSVMDVMANIPGFVMSESPSGNGYPGIRGITSHMNIMVNGIPLGKDYYFQMGTMSTGGIERIEVVKGGSAVLYGSSATTGVINIITNKGNETRLKVGAGNRGQKLVSGYAGNKTFSVSYDFYDTEDAGLSYDNGANRYMRDKIKRTNYAFQANPNEHVNVMFMHNDKYARSGIDNKNGAARGFWLNKTRYDMLQTTYSNKDLRAIMYYQDRKWDYNLVNAGRVSKGIESGKYYGIDLKNKWDLGRTELTAGGEFESERGKNTTTKVFKRIRNHGSVFFMTDTKVAKKTNVLFGAREVFTGSNGNSFNPQLQILQKATDKDSFYVNVNKSLLEAPVSRKYGYSDSFIPNPDLKPEKGWTYEVGYKKKVGNNGLFKLDAYHMKIDDRMYSTKVVVDGKQYSTYENATKYKNTGVELSYEWQTPKGFSYGLGISYSNPQQISKPGGDWADAESRLGGHADLTYRMGKGTIAITGNYVGARSTNVNHLINIEMNSMYKMTDKDTISLKLYNLLDREDPRSISGGSVLPARNWMLSYERKF